MKGLRVSRVINVECILTADGWNLYDKEKREEVAYRLNRQVEYLVNKEQVDRTRFIHEMTIMMNEFGNYGAWDGECRDVLHALAGNIYEARI